jgi:hypothetical protein
MGAPSTKRRRQEGAGGGGGASAARHLEDVLADLANEDTYDFNQGIENYHYERYQPISVLPTNTSTRAPINFRLDPYQGVHLNTRDMYLEYEVVVETRKQGETGI